MVEKSLYISILVYYVEFYSNSLLSKFWEYVEREREIFFAS